MHSKVVDSRVPNSPTHLLLEASDAGNLSSSLTNQASQREKKPTKELVVIFRPDCIDKILPCEDSILASRV